MDHIEEIKKLIAKFREYRDITECVQCYDLIDKIEDHIDKKLANPKPPWMEDNNADNQT